MRKIRVHMVSTSFDPFDGGLQQSAERIAVLLSELPYVELYTYSRKKISERISKNDILGKPNYWGSNDSPLIDYDIVENLPSEERYRAEIKNLEREISKNIKGIDINNNVILSLSISSVGFISQCVASDLCLKHIVSARGSDLNRDTFTPTGLSMFNFILDNVDYIVTTNLKQKEIINKRVKQRKKISVIYNSVLDTNEYLFLRENMSNTNEQFCIFSDIGLSQKKGSIYLIDSVKRLLDKKKNIKLTLVGGIELGKHSDKKEKAGWMRLCSNLQEKYPGAFIFLDRLHQNEIKQYLKISDLYVSPSLGEGCSNAINKALLSGIPSVLSDTGATKELIGCVNNIIYVEPGNSKELLDAISTFIHRKNNNTLEDVNLNLRKPILQKLSKETEKSCWDKVLRDTMDYNCSIKVDRPPRILFYLYDGTGLGHLSRCCKIAEELQYYSSCLILTGQKAVAYFAPDKTEFVHIPSLDSLLPEKSRYWRKQPFLEMPYREVYRFRSNLIKSVWDSYEPDIVFTDYLPFGLNNELIDIINNKSRNYLLLRGCLDDEENVKKDIFPSNTIREFEKIYSKCFVCCDRKVYDLKNEIPFINQINIPFEQVGYVGNRISESAIMNIRKQRGIMEGRLWCVCSAGGGAVGEKMICECVKIANKFNNVYFDIIYGSKSGENWPMEGMLDYYENNIHYIKETPFLDYLHASADIVITTGGYNSVLEALSGRAHLLIVPSQRKKTDEQWIHAKHLSNFVSLSLVENLFELEKEFVKVLNKQPNKINSSVFIEFDAGVKIRNTVLQEYYNENNV